MKGDKKSSTWYFNQLYRISYSLSFFFFLAPVIMYNYYFKSNIDLYAKHVLLFYRITEGDTIVTRDNNISYFTTKRERR